MFPSSPPPLLSFPTRHKLQRGKVCQGTIYVKYLFDANYTSLSMLSNNAKPKQAIKIFDQMQFWPHAFPIVNRYGYIFIHSRE